MFSKQIEKNIRNANHKLYVFRKIRNCLDNQTALTIFKTMVMPYIEFGSLLFTGCNAREKTK